MLLSRMTPKAALLAAGLAVLAVAAPAGAKTYTLSGRQIAIDEGAGKFRVTGALVGRWNVTRFDTLATSPLVQATGTELFRGCLDLRRNGCGPRDPKGTLSLTMTYEALFASADPGSLVWGSCRHPIVSGTGGFAGAKGVVAMVDTPTPGGIRTDYIGNLTLPGKGHSHDRARTAARAAAATSACGAG